jgi:hypothetical protein
MRNLHETGYAIELNKLEKTADASCHTTLFPVDNGGFPD